MQSYKLNRAYVRESKRESNVGVGGGMRLGGVGVGGLFKENREGTPP